MKKLISIFGSLLLTLVIVSTVSAANLITNGSFESPVITNTKGWDTYISGTSGLDWTVEYTGSYGTGYIELQKSGNLPDTNEIPDTWIAKEGNQYTELDSFHPIKISQDIQTQTGYQYVIKYSWSPRPGRSDNHIEVYWGDEKIGDHSAVGGGSTSWNDVTVTRNGTGDTKSLKFVEVGADDAYGTFVDAVSVEEVVIRTAEITAPSTGANVSGSVNFTAYLTDDDPDAIQWAIRQGTCAMGVNTIYGNVDGHSDIATVNQSNLSNQTFSFTGNMTGKTPGMYCFIYNPTEDAGETDIRLTREFNVIDLDLDDDGVINENDLCGETRTTDTPDVELGVNRHIWKGGDYFLTLVPGSKGSKTNETSEFNLDFTYGCSCEQILDSMSKTVQADFTGHYKYGCSKSILEDWNRGTYHIGPTFVETVNIPADKDTDTLSVNTLKDGVTYFLKAYGTADAGDNIQFDARYSFRTGSSTDWTDAVSTYESYGVTLLDLLFNGITPWGSYTNTHSYEYTTTGDGNKAAFKIYDVYSPNNTGSLSVDITEDKWVDLH